MGGSAPGKNTVVRLPPRSSVGLIGLGVVWLLSVASCQREPPTEHETQAALPKSAPSHALGPTPKALLPAEPSDAEASPQAEPEEFVVIAGGDVSYGRECGQAVIKNPDFNPLAGLGSIWAKGDLNFINLESQLSDQDGETQSPRNRLIFTGPPEGARSLRLAGIHLVSTANNHAWDYGRDAFFETLEYLSAAGVRNTGTSAKAGQAYRPTVFRAKGWSVAFFGVTDIWNQPPFKKHEGRKYVAWADFEQLKPYLRLARQRHDLVFVSYHSGSEYVEFPMAWTRRFVKQLMRERVDAIFGHHPHIMQGVGWTENRPTFYSLGNLVFGMHQHRPWTGTGFLARLTYRKGEGLVRAEACPYQIVGYRPSLYTGVARKALEERFEKRLDHVSITVGGTEISGPGEDGCFELSPPAPVPKPSPAVARKPG